MARLADSKISPTITIITETKSRPEFSRHFQALQWNAPGITDTSGLFYEHRRKYMSNQRFSPEFKDEAVRQVVERATARNYPVRQVAADFSARS